jgi:hypothetical protein
MVVAQMPRCSDLVISVVTDRRTEPITLSLVHVRGVTIIKGEPRHAITSFIVRSIDRTMSCIIIL